MPLIDSNIKTERIGGVFYNMSPSADLYHADVNGNLYFSLRNQLKDSLCCIYIENVDLYMDSSDQEYVIPDIMIVCDKKAFKKGTRRYYGTPKFVLETLSPSTAKKDRTVKMDLYARKGIPEYWIVDYRSKSVEIYYLENGAYQLTDTFMLQNDPDFEDYNAEEAIPLREFPNMRLVLRDIFDGIE